MKVRGDKFALIAKLDSKCQAIINTPVGPTNDLNFSNLIMQGSIFAGIKCSCSIDSIGREILSSEDDLGVYTYKGVVDVPPVSYIDDVLGISDDDVSAVELNAVLNSKMETKKLTLRSDKCVSIKIEKNKTRGLRS